METRRCLSANCENIERLRTARTIVSERVWFGLFDWTGTEPLAVASG
jgi:hypothetical protein